ncbi:MAG: M20/M25/M40 family metallo-hydrolase, partial [Chloroflexota bacterium]
MQPTDEQAIAFLEELVRIDSPSGGEAAAARYSADAMAAMGLRAEVDAAGSPVGRIGAGPRRILLLGHIDTVAGHIPVRREGNCLYGRGSVDAKGPLAAFIMAAARAGALPGCEITVVGAVEEECATSAGAYHVVADYPVADYVIIGEPSGWQRVTLGYKGRLLADYILERPMSHTAGEARGACEEAVDYWLAVRAWAERYNADKGGRFATLDPSLRSICSTCDGLAERVEM